MKRTLLTLGTVAAVAAPIAGVVACSSTNKDETYKGSLGDKKLKILTLGDSVAHGDYTFQMSGSGTPFMPLLDGPARAASYQDFLFDEFKRDGLMDEATMPNYRTSASGLRSGELAQWLKPGSNYVKGQQLDNPDYKTVGSEDQIHVDYHRHPYTEGSTGKTWWDDGLKDDKGVHIDAHHSDVLPGQKDTMTMEEHVKESDIVLITIGGNDILKDIMVAGNPFPSLASNGIMSSLPKIIGELKADATIQSLPHIKAIVDGIATQLQAASAAGGTSSLFDTLKDQIVTMIKDKSKQSAIFAALTSKFAPLLSGIASIPTDERQKFEKWFLGDGHKLLITVDQDKLKKSLDAFSKNIKIMSDEIHITNPNAKVIFTGYPSPMMHFPKIFRNLAMPTYGEIARLTKEYADKTDNIYYAPSSLQNWETDDPNDIYDNILVDPHPTLEGQGAMAQDIIKVIDGIYGLNSNITNKELKSEVTNIIDSHKETAPTMTVEERNKEIAAGTYKYPYQSAVKEDGTADGTHRADLDYAYGLKPLPLEELTHAKIYFGSRIGMFLIDAITDSIKLNENIDDPKDQSVPHSGALTLSDFTKKWGDNYIAKGTTDRFVQGIDSSIMDNINKEFTDSLAKFIETFTTKIKGVIDDNPKVAQIVNMLS